MLRRTNIQRTPAGAEHGKFHRTASNIVYMGAAGHFYRSTDSGASWQRTTSVSDNSAIDDIAVDPLNSGRVYAATGTSVLVSQDGGLTFTPVALPNRQGSVWRIDCGVDGAIYVPDGAKMYRSNDQGRTWQVAGTFPQSNVDAYSLVAADPADARVVYVSVLGRGAFVSRDAGASWQALDSEPQLSMTLRRATVRSPCKHRQLPRKRT
ncbi:WD40/YVTN/BNR-like repeat-containing protein [Steroidobacter flavus]|uniref:WD40/YVTN/BNR-like repeat-containing protein n=1 Tax=Steroidobacter flavus TaxID=1842136 RepID=A0ABV8T549_9GAMM